MLTNVDKCWQMLTNVNKCSQILTNVKTSWGWAVPSSDMIKLAMYLLDYSDIKKLKSTVIKS